MRQRTFFLGALLIFVASCQGCFGCNTSPIDNPDLVLVRSCESAPPLIEPPRLDILFVIDNSNSMREEQEAVANSLTKFVDVIKQSGGVPTDFNIGVITTSVYLNGRVGGQPFILNFPKQAGRLRPVPADLPDGGLDLEPVGAQRLLSGTDPDLIAKFSKLVKQGTSGSGQETPFEAVRLALLTELATTPILNGGNQEFLRDGARLLVVVLSDEDDCSEEVRPPLVSVGDNPSVADCTVNEMQLTTVSEYHRMFTEDLKNSDGTVKEVIWTAIAPVSNNGMKTAQGIVDTTTGQVRNVDCPTSNQGGYRHRAMSEMFDNTLVNLDSICQSDFSATLINIAELASVSQTIEIKNVPDERLMQFIITRKTGDVEICTIANEGIVNFSRATDGKSARVQFGNQCRRRADDQTITIKMICAT